LGRLELVQLRSPQQVRAAAAAWDRLWQRSPVCSALFRAEMTAQWLEQFAAAEQIQVLAVARDGEFLAMLPLAGRRVRRFLRVGDLPINCWSPSGELLLDDGPEQAETLDLLIDGLRGVPWPLVWFDTIPYREPRWQAFLAAAARGGCMTQVCPRYRIGQVELQAGPGGHEARWSKNHRRNLRKDERRLQSLGPLRLVVHRQWNGDLPVELLHRGFEIEDHSWKGPAGTSVLRTPGMFEFFLRQARQLAAWGSLRLAFLEHGGRPIAFEYGWLAKGVYYSYKVGYDPEFATYGPGHLLRLYLLRELAAEPDVRLVDFHGPLTEALACWATGSYAIGRMIVAPRRIGSRLLISGLTAARRLTSKRVRGLGFGDWGLEYETTPFPIPDP
jgi:CelD/BcsL family acetyltransferase involved in cellulose biosynthesis